MNDNMITELKIPIPGLLSPEKSTSIRKRLQSNPLINKAYNYTKRKSTELHCCYNHQKTNQLMPNIRKSGKASPNFQSTPRGSFGPSSQNDTTVQQLFQILSNQNLENAVFLDKSLGIVRKMFFESMLVPVNLKEDHIEEIFQKFEDYFDCQKDLNSEIVEDALSIFEMIEDGKYKDLTKEIKKEIETAKSTSGNFDFFNQNMSNIHSHVSYSDISEISEKTKSATQSHFDFSCSITTPSMMAKEDNNRVSLSDIESVSSDGETVVDQSLIGVKEGFSFEIEKIETGIESER